MEFAMRSLLLRRAFPALAAAAAVAMTSLADTGPAFPEAKEKLTKKAWIGCGTKMSKTRPKTRIDATTGEVLCPKGQRMATRAEANNACRDQMNQFSMMTVKLSDGWLCRYHGP
jgi:hypothetical protein